MTTEKPAEKLSANLRSFVIRAVDEFHTRFLPDDVLPRIAGGYRQYERTDSALINLHAALARLGVDNVCGKPVLQRLRSALAAIGDRKYETWWSMWIGEALAGTGSAWNGHPLLAGLPSETLDRIKKAVNTTHIVDPKTLSLPGHPNNYWMCLARAERARLRLGLTTDDAMYRLALSRTADLLLSSPRGYMDDCREQRGRYDGYSFTALGNTGDRQNV